jgi:hypothetical protein
MVLNVFPFREVKRTISLSEWSSTRIRPTDLKEPVGMGEGAWSADERHGLEQHTNCDDN